MSSVDGMSHPQSYEILLFPEPEESAVGAPEPGTAIRSAVVDATGDNGRSGYPRYEGGGLEADIDPASHTVEALLVDGAELDYGLTVRIAERIRGTGGAPEAASPEPGGEDGDAGTRDPAGKDAPPPGRPGTG